MICFRFAALLVFVSMLPAVRAAGQTASEKIPPEIAKWENDIQVLEKLDADRQDVGESVLFVGSSSIRLWDSLATDMQPWKTIRKGYGGARLTDLNHYADRLIGPYLGAGNSRRCKAVVVFVANDISGGKNDPSPDEVSDRFRRLHQFVRQQDATMPLFWIEVTPSRKRWEVWPQIREATAKIRTQLNSDPYAYFIPTAGAFWDDSGKPDSDLFRDDQLHLNRDGYRLWEGLIKAQLHLRLGNPAVGD